MRIIRTSDDGAREMIRAMQEKLSVTAGAETSSSRAKTLEVFGEALSPQEAVRRIVGAVRREGDAAVFRYTALLDGFTLDASSVRVSADEIARAKGVVSGEFLKAAEAAIANVRRFQEHILRRAPADLTDAGKRMGIRYVPVRRAGIYVPGFSATLPSSVIMNCVPAQVAGVEAIALATPPRATGEICPEILACCALLGIDEVYRIGGAQAVAALALGTESIPKVDMVVGPGNIFTTLAKKEVFGDAAIDLLAGPSEVLVLADDSARPDVVAADVLSQAEHAPAAAFLVTPSAMLAEAVAREIERQLATLSRRDATRKVLEEYALAIVTDTMDEAIAITNDLAPEHLQITTADDEMVLARVRNAGTVFVGAWTPIAAGDYYAGPSHTLPTGGTAKYQSGLSANAFLRQMSIVRYDEASLAADAKDITTLAEAEGLTAHAESVRARFREEKR